MTWVAILNSSAALIFVICLIGLVSLLLKKYGNIQANLEGSQKTIKILEVKRIDQKSKIISIEKSGKQYLVLNSSEGNLLLDKDDEKEDGEAFENV